MNPVLAELHDKARAVLDPVHYDFFAGGAGDEVVLAENEAAFRRLALLPRVLRGNATTDDFPVLISPTAFHKLAHPDGELATARAAGRSPSCRRLMFGPPSTGNLLREPFTGFFSPSQAICRSACWRPIRMPFLMPR